MKQQIIFIMMMLFFSCNANALSDALKKKYPNSVLTDDYGILNEVDLKDERPAPFSPSSHKAYRHWQCFLREDLRIYLADLGYTSEDIGGDENYSMLKITISNNSNVSHRYAMRRIWPLGTYESKFDSWVKLMHGEKYVCLKGEFSACKDKIISGKKNQMCEWIFEKMKTKKGIDSYSSQ